MAKKLTKLMVDKATSGGLRQRDIPDGDVHGFGLRVTSGCVKTFVVRYRDRGGNSRRLTLGRHGVLTVEEARRMAREALARVAKGCDPASERRVAREALTLTEHAEAVLAENAKRWSENYQRDVRGILRDHILPVLGRKKVADVTFADVRKLHGSLRVTPSLANKTAAVLKKLFAVAAADELCTGNPCAGVKLFHEEKRTRSLTDEEMRRLVEAVRRHPNRAAANAISLLLLTGARRNEVFRATWDMFDFASGVWTKPSHHTKQKRTHVAPLSAVARQVLSAMKAEALPGCPYLFPNEAGTAPVADFRRSWAGMRKEAGLEDFHLHDLRHTFASRLASRGASLAVIGALLGHTQAATTHRYAHLTQDALAQAADGVGEEIAAIGKGHTAEVIHMPERASKASA